MAKEDEQVNLGSPISDLLMPVGNETGRVEGSIRGHQPAPDGRRPEMECVLSARHDLRLRLTC